jgi:hypothetical protein
MCGLTAHESRRLQTTSLVMSIKLVVPQGWSAVSESEHVTVPFVRVANCMQERSTGCTEKYVGREYVNKIQLVSIL